MTLVHVPVPLEAVDETAPIWGPFLESIAERTKQSVQQLVEQVYPGAIELHLVWNPEEQKALGLAGTRILLYGEDRVGELVWCTGMDRSKWIDLLADVEKYMKDHRGCKAMHAVARPGWSKDLKARGYKVTHLVLKKGLVDG